jgi:integrase
MRRSARGEGLPPNTYHHAASGLYRYQRPDNKVWHYIGRDRALAIKAANRLNALLLGTSDLVEQVLMSGIPTLKAGIEKYAEEELPKLTLGKKTREDYQGILKRLAKAAPSVRVGDVRVRHCSDTLKMAAAGDRAYQRARSQLSHVFRYFMAEGWTEANFAEMTREGQWKRKRLRLTIEGFQAVRAAAPLWFQGAMDVALRSLQREEDLSVMRWPVDGLVRVEQLKTGQRVEMELWPDLQAAIAACRDDLICPFIIHRRPEKARPSDKRAEARLHFAQVMPDQLSNAFLEARRESQFYDEESELAPPPCFHEIRSLGASLYRNAKWPEELIQDLLGHEDIKQTREYLDGHDAPWVRVSGV